MFKSDLENTLVAAAVGGDVSALEQLLFAYRPRLLAYSQRMLPAELRRLVEPEDVLQDTCFEAARRIRTFTVEGEDCLYRWLLTIMRHQILQLLRARRTLRRGGGLTRGDSVAALLENFASTSNTPSRSAASHELRARIEQSIEQLPEDYATAIRLRYLDALPFADVAVRMDRSERAAQMLCNRALKLLREDMESISNFE